MCDCALNRQVLSQRFWTAIPDMTRYGWVGVTLLGWLVGCGPTPWEGTGHLAKSAPEKEAVVATSEVMPLDSPEVAEEGSTGKAPPPQNEEVTTAPVEQPQSEFNGEPLLLMNEDSEFDVDFMALNGRCMVCHLNYLQDEISLVHARAGYGCAHCHGESDEHIADESWASGGPGTPPDIMYRADEVVPVCLKCHELLPSDPDCRCEFPRLAQKKSCTDCHGTHRLQTRKCSWK